MNLNSNKFFTSLIFIVFFFSFSGYYFVLILLANNGLLSLSRIFTIPLRFFILFLLIIAVIYKKSSIKVNSLLFFKLFAFFYLLRILFEANFNNHYHLSELEFFFYFISFVLLPLILLSKINFNESDYDYIFFAIVLSSFILSLATIFYYKDFIGSGARITSFVSRDQNYISPLALSYCSILLIGVSSFYLLTNKLYFYRKCFIVFSIIISLIPFFLGASRGSVFALVIPFIFYFIFKKGLKNKTTLIAVIIVLSMLMLVAVNYLGSSVFDRFYNIQNDIDSDSTSSYRLTMYKSGIEQYFKNPFFGNSLELTLTGYHPHNIFIEILITTGFFGFLPFFLFIFFLIKKSILILRYSPKKYWVCVIFFQALIQNQFSGSIYSASWLAIGSGLVLATSKTIK